MASYTVTIWLSGAWPPSHNLHSVCQQILFCLHNYPEPNCFSPVFVLLPPRYRSLSFLIMTKRRNIQWYHNIFLLVSLFSPCSEHLFSTEPLELLLKHVLTQRFAENSPMTPQFLKVKSKSWVTKHTLGHPLYLPAHHPVPFDFLWDHSPLWSLCHNQTGLLLDPGTSQGDSCPLLLECSSPSDLYSLLPAFLWSLFLSQPLLTTHLTWYTVSI